MHCALCIVSLCLAACDSGDIVEQEYSTAERGRTVKLTATLSGVDTWESRYSVSLAGFTTGDNYAQVVRSLPNTTADGTRVELVLSNIDEAVNTIELAITNRLRERIITLASVNLEDYADTGDTIRMELGHVDVSRMRVVGGDAEGSLMRQILNEGGEDILGYNHTEVLSSQFKENLTEVRQLIDDWIKGLGNRD